MTDRTLAGCRIVIVEDDFYQALDCRLLLEAEGAIVVSSSATIPDLSALQQDGRIDAALIDVNLGHGLSFDFARELKAQGIPFVFLTGYGEAILPDDLAGAGYLTKPANAKRIMAALESATGDAR